MKKSVFVFVSLICLMCLMSPFSAEAIVFTQTGAVLTADYNEPTKNTDGTALTDLHHTTLYYEIDGVVSKAKDVPATSVSGGGNINTTFEVPVTAGNDKIVKCWATAFDDNDNESAKSNVVSVTIDRLAPEPPN